mgnify:CR=1 FL=1|tara:strand:+ start:47133 stop:47993 length:861 start_codon:yes stop_codon:yes gene_type:complete
MKIGIVGNGYVGNATALLQDFEGVECIAYDIEPARCNPRGVELKDLSDCELIFICVPTPMLVDGSCSIHSVESAVEDLKKASIDLNKVVVRSTVPVGTCKKLGVSFMPEFLTEANWREDFKKNKDWIIGIDSKDDKDSPELWDKRAVFTKLATAAYKNMHYMTTKEAECVKLVRNSFLAIKVSFFNEIEEFCRGRSIDFETVRLGVTQDKRIGRSHSKVPGPDGMRGFGGTCFPKDLHSLFHQIHEMHHKDSEMDTPSLISAALSRNENVDRKNRDWENNKGRSVV